MCVGENVVRVCVMLRDVCVGVFACVLCGRGRLRLYKLDRVKDFEGQRMKKAAAVVLCRSFCEMMW